MAQPRKVAAIVARAATIFWCNLATPKIFSLSLHPFLTVSKSEIFPSWNLKINNLSFAELAKEEKIIFWAEMSWTVENFCWGELAELGPL